MVRVESKQFQRFLLIGFLLRLDIMLGFLRSRLDKEQMLQQQRKAVSGILLWCESQDEVQVTGDTIRAEVGEHMDWVRMMVMCTQKRLILAVYCRPVSQSRFGASYATRARPEAPASRGRR